MVKIKKKENMRCIFLSFYFFVIVVMAIVFYMAFPMVNFILNRYFEKQITTYYTGLTKGVYYVTTHNLLKRPKDEWLDYVEQLQDKFEYPIYIKSLDSIELGDEERRQLMAGEIIALSKWEMFYQRIGMSNDILVMGPIFDLKLGRLEYAILIWTPIILILFPITLLWIIPFWKRITKIIKAADSFGEGNFSVRAKILKHSALYPLAETFNAMADRIQHLINSHKQLSSAVSHELRTPISRIHFSLEMLENPNEGHLKNTHYLSEIRKDIDELEMLVSELLSYARLDRERPEFDFADIPLTLFMEKVIGEVQKDFEALTMDVVF